MRTGGSPSFIVGASAADDRPATTSPIQKERKDSVISKSDVTFSAIEKRMKELEEFR